MQGKKQEGSWKPEFQTKPGLWMGIGGERFATKIEADAWGLTIGIGNGFTPADVRIVESSDRPNSRAFKIGGRYETVTEADRC